MKCKVEFMGWSKTADSAEWQHPDGYYGYLLLASNGVIRQYYEWADSNKQIADGEYDLPDALFDMESDYWDKDTEEIVA